MTTGGVMNKHVSLKPDVTLREHVPLKPYVGVERFVGSALLAALAFTLILAVIFYEPARAIFV